MRWLFRLCVSALAVGGAAYLVPGVSVTIRGAFITAVVLGVLNLFIRPLLILLTLPVTLITLGLFSLVINALLVMVAAFIVPDFSVSGFSSAFLFALVLSLVHMVIGKRA